MILVLILSSTILCYGATIYLHFLSNVFCRQRFFQTVSLSIFSKSLFSNGFHVYVFFIFKPFLLTRIIMGRPETQSLIDISLIQPWTVRQTRHGGQYCFSEQPWVWRWPCTARQPRRISPESRNQELYKVGPQYFDQVVW